MLPPLLSSAETIFARNIFPYVLQPSSTSSTEVIIGVAYYCLVWGILFVCHLLLDCTEGVTNAAITALNFKADCDNMCSGLSFETLGDVYFVHPDEIVFRNWFCFSSPVQLWKIRFLSAPLLFGDVLMLESNCENLLCEAPLATILRINVVPSGFTSQFFCLYYRQT